MNSAPILIFSDPNIFTSEKLESALNQYQKSYETQFMNTPEGKNALLEEYKDIFGHLSGLEINQDVNLYVEESFPAKLKFEL